jgi:UPF0042 nucleotide-binding protein
MDRAAFQEIVLVTGPSGAGRATATRALEDLGFEAIDNIPLGLIPRLLVGTPPERPLALGVDVRTRDFSVAALTALVGRLQEDASYRSQLLYLDCRPDVLVRRFSETRRRHPLSVKETPAAAIELELALLDPLRAEADIVIDTSDFTPHDLKADLERWFGGAGDQRLAVSVQSFSYKRGLPPGLDSAFDVRFLTNPHWVEDLRPLDGRDAQVAAYVASDPAYSDFIERVTGLTLSLLPRYRDEGKAHFALGFGCTGGRHRSVSVAEILAKALADAGWQVSIRHRELERRPEGAGRGRTG